MLGDCRSLMMMVMMKRDEARSTGSHHQLKRRKKKRRRSPKSRMMMSSTCLIMSQIHLVSSTGTPGKQNFVVFFSRPGKCLEFAQKWEKPGILTPN